LTVASLALTAAGLVGILNWEGWSPKAVPPVKGDVPTYGFGTTTDVAGQPLKGGRDDHAARGRVAGATRRAGGRGAHLTKTFAGVIVSTF
jgi:hypothetical protein